MRANSCSFSPFFSTACCATMSPIPKSTEVVAACVSSGLAASLALYLVNRISMAAKKQEEGGFRNTYHLNMFDLNRDSFR